MLALLDARAGLPNRFRLASLLRFTEDLFLHTPTGVNKRAITDHYTLGSDVYLTFINHRYWFYSHCIFESDDETLEEAAEHKLQSMCRALDLQPTMRCWIIGAGWGGVFDTPGREGCTLQI